MNRVLCNKFISCLLLIALILWNFPFEINKAEALAGVKKIRQEINIIDAVLSAASGSYATSSASITLDTTKYNDATYYFEIVARTASAVSSNVYLRSTTTSATAATQNFSNSNAYTLYRTQFSPPSGSNDFVVVVGNEAVQKDVIAARVVIFQNGTTLANTQTQIEIGNEETGKSNTSTIALSSPKYWLYDSSKWDGSPTFSAEVTYKNIQVSSSTVYTVTATTTKKTATYTVSSVGVSYTVVEAWGAGGGGRGSTSTAGGGAGGGGAYARSTTTPGVAGSTHTLVIAPGGAPASTTNAVNTSYDATTVVADSAEGTNSATGTAGGTTANSTGLVKFAGGTGGNALTTDDTGGGGGGAAGPNGAGGGGAAGQTATGGGGGGGNGGSTATTITGGTSTNGGAGGDGGNATAGKSGIADVRGGGGGGGSDNALAGGPGGAPGGGGGGGDAADTTVAVGGPGQIKLTEVYGKVGFCLEEDNGSFTFTCKFMIADQVVSTSSPTKTRISFTPTTGRNYRITASTTSSSATYNVYSAKIIVDQTSPTKLEAQYLLANTTLAAGTSLQKFLTKWDANEWNTTNVYIHEANSVSGGTSDIKLQDSSGSPDVTNSTITDVIQREQSSTLTMPTSPSTLDVIATTNNNDLYCSRILVQVTLPSDPSEGTRSSLYSGINFLSGRIRFFGGRVLFK